MEAQQAQIAQNDDQANESDATVSDASEKGEDRQQSLKLNVV